MWAKIIIKNTVDSEEISNRLLEWGFPLLWVEESENETVYVFDQVEKVENKIDWDAQSEQHSPYFSDGFISIENLKLKPGAGFGDLSHPTTQLMVTLMTDLHGTIYDLGTGNGILACLAKSRGAEKVFAWDIDGEALDLAKENAALNNLEIIFEPHLIPDILLVNMIFSEQLHALKGISAKRVIASGLREVDLPQYLELFKGYTLENKIEKDGWIGIILMK
jgi:ribosomal protein L11 methyltransferase